MLSNLVKIKKFIFSLSFPILVTIIIPTLLLIFVEKRAIFDVLSSHLYFIILGGAIIGIGLILFISCNLVFIKKGSGTLMPLRSTETRTLVIVGPYKYVRNPMIIAVLVILLGESFFFGSFWILIFTAIFFIGNLIYIPLVEEKGMEKRFGNRFLHYKQNVRSWIPSTKPYVPLSNI